MLNAKFLDELSARVAQLAAATPAADFEKNTKALIAGMFSKLDLVTREEFDIQRELLSRAMARLAALEAQIAAQEFRE